MSKAKAKPMPANMAAHIGTAVDKAKRELLALDQEIKADTAGRAEYNAILERAQAKRDALLARIKENQTFADQFDKDIGPFHANFERMVAETGKLYGDAKEKHAAGVELLCRDFGYHPAYRRWHDTFTATPWKPQ